MSVEASTKKKILLAEDDASMRRFIEVSLQKANYEVVSAEDGLAAMKIALGGETIDIIVADAIMPNMTGHDLCRILRQNPQTKELPFIILSGFEQSESLGGAAKNSLADAYLLKGANLKEELLNTLSKFLTERKATS